MNLPRLYDPRIKGNMIDTDKIASGVEKLNSRRLFQMSTFQGRSHSKKLYPKYARLNVRKHWFTQRVIAKWNSLSQDEVVANKTSCFKARYDKKKQNEKE